MATFPDRIPALFVVLDAGILAAHGRTSRGVAAAVLSGVPTGSVALVERDKRPAQDRARWVELQAVSACATEHGAPLIVSGRADLAELVGADGVQLGERGLTVQAVRRTFPRLAIGRSCHDVAGATRAHADGADWVTVAPVFLPLSKPAIGEALGLEGLAAVVDAFDGRAIALGGVSIGRAQGARRAGASGVGSIASVTLADDPAGAANALLKAWNMAGGI